MVVIGAGLAGLTSALDLVDAGWDVIVLEARDRVGGRVHTLRDPFSDGLHAEGGGESIDDNHKDLEAMVTRFGLRTEPRPPDKEAHGVVFAGGRRMPTSAYVAGRDRRVLADYLRFDRAVEALGADVDAAHPDRAANAEQLDGRTLASFIEDQHLVPEAALLVRAEQRGEFNAEPVDVSLLFVAQQAAADMAARDGGAETMRIAGGNSGLVEAMAAALGSRVLLSTPVEKVTWDANSVRVSAGGADFDAAWLIVACPFVPLRRVQFSPELPSTLAAAVAGIDLGSAAKVATQYAKRFWATGDSTAFTVSDLPFAISWESTDSYVTDPDQPGIVAQFITGDPARAAATLNDADRIGQFQTQLDRVWPEGAALKTGHAASVAWAKEPYTGGGYAVWRPGQLTQFWSTIRSGTGPIRFAGEHTEALAGYMDSAVRSGHRVAAELGRAPSR